MNEERQRSIAFNNGQLLGSLEGTDRLDYLLGTYDEDFEVYKPLKDRELQRTGSKSGLAKLETLQVQAEDSTKNVIFRESYFYRVVFTVQFVCVVSDADQVYSVMVVPLKLSFFLLEEKDPLLVAVLDRAVKSFFLFELVLRFFMPVYSKYEIEVDHREIFRMNVREVSFYVDIYAAIPWEDIFFTGLKLSRHLTLATLVHLSTLSSVVASASQYKMYSQMKDYRSGFPLNFISKTVQDNYSRRGTCR